MDGVSQVREPCQDGANDVDKVKEHFFRRHQGIWRKLGERAVCPVLPRRAA